MNFWQLMLSISFLGAIGGFVNCFLSNEFRLPEFNNNVWRPGWIGNVLIGLVAADLLAIMYGPLSGYDIINHKGLPTELLASEIGGAVLVGISGGRILTQLAQINADRLTKSNLINALETFNKGKDNE